MWRVKDGIQGQASVGRTVRHPAGVGYEVLTQTFLQFNFSGRLSNGVPPSKQANQRKGRERRAREEGEC